MTENILTDKELKIIIHIALIEGMIFQDQIKTPRAAFDEAHVKVRDRMTTTIFRRIKNRTFFNNSDIPDIQESLRKIRENDE